MAKRGIDFAAAVLGLLFLSPLLLLIAALVKLTSSGPVLHRAVRAGREGKLFCLFKFRSMSPDADRAGPGLTRSGDPRVTPLGGWLRRLKLDELPQLFNVLKGDMSLVGPRPEDPSYVAYYTPEQRKVLSVRPGITSAASVLYRHEEALLTGTDWEEVYLKVIMPDKLRIDLDYLSQESLVSDLGILVRTAVAIFR
jgi:lipopolysaccharide/colanic/teichoic acid biosynthesis glycosyltransferase